MVATSAISGEAEILVDDGGDGIHEVQVGGHLI
jgi:hypothetical protein